MKIRYKKKNSKYNLIIGLFWLVWFWVGVFTLDKTNWYDWGMLVISLLYIATYFYQIKYQYAEITADLVKTNDFLIGKKLKIGDVKTVRKFAGDYIFKTATKELTINTQVISSESLNQLNAKIEELGISWS